jgi:hypothetical protein
MLKGSMANAWLAVACPQETICQRPISLGSYQLVGGHPLPEIGSIHAKEFAGFPAKQANQGRRRGSISCGGRKFKQQSLKSIV